MELIDILTGLIFYSPALSAFIAGFLAEEILLVLIFLAGQDKFSFWTIAIWGLIGVFCIDSAYYLAGRLKRFHKWAGRIIEKSAYKRFANKTADFTKKSPIFSLFLSKFIYGPRMVLIMYFSHKGMPYRKFVVYEITALLLWGALMLPLVALFGAWVLYILKVIKNIEKIILIAIVVIFLYSILSRKLGLRFILNGKKN